MSTRMKAPPKCTFMSVEGGAEYVPDKTGHVTVNNPAHVPFLARHGFTAVPDEVTEEEEAEFEAMTKSELIDWIEERDENALEDKKYTKPQLVEIAEGIAAKAKDAE